MSEIKSWPQEWNPDHGTRFQKAYWKAFQFFLIRNIAKLEKKLEDMKWVEVP